MHQPWYAPDKEDIDDEKHRAGRLIMETAAIEQRQSSWHELNLWNATLYTNRELGGFRWGALEADQELWPVNLRTENIIEEIGDAMLSKASSSPLKPTPIPHGKSWKVERAVRRFDQFMFGVWRQTQAEDACVQVFSDAYQAGLGCARIAYSGIKKTIHVESVFFDNIIIDNRECANRAPPRTYRIRQVLPRASVEARYGITLGEQRHYVDYREVGDGYVVLVEAWRLPDERGKGGWHMVACCDEILDEGPWKHDWVPLVFFHWKDRGNGFFCKSGVEQLVPFQNRHNQLNDDIQEAQDITCRPRLTMQANSMIDVSQWDNQAGRILLWSGSKPEPFEWRANLADLYQERERNKAAAFSHAGMSEMFANADLPNQVRLDSSAGVREVRNMEDARHLRLWTRFERFRLDVARTIMLVLSISKDADAFTSVYHPGGARASAKNIPYADVKTLTEDQYSWTLDAIPLSAMSPAARRELVRDWTSRGLLDDGEARRMEGNTNLERTEDLELASYDDIYRHIELLEEGEYEAPTELTNLTFGIKKVTANLHRLRDYEDVDPQVLENHVRWIAKGTSIMVAATQPPPQPDQMTAFAPTQGMAGTSAAKLGAGQPGA